MGPQYFLCRFVSFVIAIPSSKALFSLPWSLRASYLQVAGAKSGEKTLSITDFNFKENGISYIQSLPIFEEDSLKGEIMKTWMNLTVGNKRKRGRVFTWSKIEKSLISNLDERQFLSENSEFIRNELDLDSVEVYKVGEGEDIAGKAVSAFPLEPGISFLS